MEPDAPFWVVAVPYDAPAGFSERWPGQRRILAGSFAWEGTEPWPDFWPEAERYTPAMEALPTPAPLLLGHDPKRRCGEVLRWVDRPEALYAQARLDDRDCPGTAWRARHHLRHSCDSTLSIGFWVLEDELGPRSDGLRMNAEWRHAAGVTRAAIQELSVCLGRGAYPQTRMLSDAEAERMLRDEPVDLEHVRYSVVDRLELGLV